MNTSRLCLMKSLTNDILSDKVWGLHMDNVCLSSRMPATFVKRFAETAKKQLEELESYLIEFKRQLYIEFSAHSVATGEVTSDQTTLEFTCNESKCNRKGEKGKKGEKRKKGKGTL